MSDALVPQVVDQHHKPVVPAKAPRLHPKKAAFCRALSASWNIKKAVTTAGIDRLAGLKSIDPLQIGQRLLSEKGVIEYLEWLHDNRGPDFRPSNAWLREQTLAVAGQDLSDALEFEKPDPDGFRELKALRLDKIDGRTISAIDYSYDASGKPHIKVKFHPKIEAQKMLWEEAGMLGGETRLPPVVNVQINLG